MKRVVVIAIVALLVSGAAWAQTESKPLRFEVSAEKGLFSILSGPDISDTSNFAARFGYMPNPGFHLTLRYERVEGTLARDDDALGNDFIVKFRDTVNSGTNFQNAILDKRDIELKQLELGIVKTIPLSGKKWETYIGIGIGTSDTTADISWTGAVRSDNGQPTHPSLKVKSDKEFFTSVRGGVRYMPLRWVGAQLDVRLVPIGKMIDADFNSLEVNGGVVFRFGAF